MMKTLFAILTAATAIAAVPAILLPVSFEPNQGQTDARVKFLARDHGAMLWFTEQGPVVGIPGKGGEAVVKMRFDGAKKSPKIEGEDRLDGVSNYFIGAKEAGWRTDVPHFAKLRYRELYPGIDVVFYGSAQEIEYDFVVAPGADPSRIRLAFEGAERLTEDAGDLVIHVGDVEIRHRKPSIRQGTKVIQGRYTLRGKTRAGFKIDAYDRAQALTIDPVLTYATYLGGTNGEAANGVAIDAQGNIIVVGYTTSANFPTVSPLYPTYPPALFISPSAQAFIVKFNPSLSGAASVIFSTFFASPDGTTANAVALDKSGNIYFTGSSYDDDGMPPLKNPFQTMAGDDQDCGGPGIICADAFVAKLNAAGNQLLFSSIFGGSNWDQGNAIAVDAAGNMYIAGYTASGTFKVLGPGQPYQFQLFGNTDAFLVMVGPAGNLIYSTFFGGNGNTNFSSVAVDSSGMVWAAGSTSATQIAGTSGAYQAALQGTASAIVAKFNLTLTGTQALQYFTYLGGAGGASAANGMALDSAGNVYLAGGTSSASFPVTAGAPDVTYIDGINHIGGATGDGFVAKLNPSAQGQAELIYSTLIGGGFDDYATAIAVDSAGRITVTGITNSPDFPVTSDAFQCCYTGFVASGFISGYGFLTRFDPSKSGAASLVYSTLLGGSTNTLLSALAMDAPGNTVAVAGLVQSPDSPVTQSAFQPKFGGQFTSNQQFTNLGGDAYMARFDFTTVGPAIKLSENGAGLSALTPAYLSPGLIFTIKGTTLGPATGVGAAIDPTTGLVANKVAGVQVLVDGVAVPLVYVSATQINAIAPYELASRVGAVVQIQTIYNGVIGNLWPAQVAATAPAIFSFDDGTGQGAIRNQDQSINGANNPASVGNIISIYATGEGQTVPAGVDGALATEPLAGIPAPKASSSVTIGGIPATIQYIGTAPGGVAGFLQVNVTVPTGVTTGSAVPVLLTIGTVASQKGLTMAIH